RLDQHAPCLDRVGKAGVPVGSRAVERLETPSDVPLEILLQKGDLLFGCRPAGLVREQLDEWATGRDVARFVVVVDAIDHSYGLWQRSVFGNAIVEVVDDLLEDEDLREYQET